MRGYFVNPKKKMRKVFTPFELDWSEDYGWDSDLYYSGDWFRLPYNGQGTVINQVEDEETGQLVDTYTNYSVGWVFLRWYQIYFHVGEHRFIYYGVVPGYSGANNGIEKRHRMDSNSFFSAKVNLVKNGRGSFLSYGDLNFVPQTEIEELIASLQKTSPRLRYFTKEQYKLNRKYAGTCGKIESVDSKEDNTSLLVMLVSASTSTTNNHYIKETKEGYTNALPYMSPSIETALYFAPDFRISLSGKTTVSSNFIFPDIQNFSHNLRNYPHITLGKPNGLDYYSPPSTGSLDLNALSYVEVLK